MVACRDCFNLEVAVLFVDVLLACCWLMLLLLAVNDGFNVCCVFCEFGVVSLVLLLLGWLVCFIGLCLLVLRLWCLLHTGCWLFLVSCLLLLVYCV